MAATVTFLLVVSQLKSDAVHKPIPEHYPCRNADLLHALSLRAKKLQKLM
jgi:hypothetical protein